jgi:hypothetical protein
MTTIGRGFLLAALATAAAVSFDGASAGEVYKCKGPHGEVTFTNIKCPDKTAVEHYGSYVPAADAPPPPQQSEAPPVATAAPVPQRAVDTPLPTSGDTERSNIVRCTKPSGEFYVKRSTCGYSVVRIPGEHGASAPRTPTGPVYDTNGMPIATASWTGPDQAFDSATGEFISGTALAHPMNHRRDNGDDDDVKKIPDTLEHVSKDEGCRSAKAAAIEARDKGFDAMRRADDTVWDICNRPADSLR